MQTDGHFTKGNAFLSVEKREVPNLEPDIIIVTDQFNILLANFISKEPGKITLPGTLRQRVLV